MRTIIKTTLLTAFLFLGLLTTLHAQEKYEYAIVTTGNREIVVTKEKTEKFPIDKNADYAQALVIKLNEMSKEGWEVFSAAVTSVSNGATGNHIFYLRKKL